MQRVQACTLYTTYLPLSNTILKIRFVCETSEVHCRGLNLNDTGISMRNKTVINACQHQQLLTKYRVAKSVV